MCWKWSRRKHRSGVPNGMGMGMDQLVHNSNLLTKNHKEISRRIGACAICRGKGEGRKRERGEREKKRRGKEA
jgi:hypothetical protein